MRCTNCSRPVTPIVAVDIDGTMGKYHEQLLRFFCDYFGRNFDDRWDGAGNWEDFLGLTHPEYQEAKLAFRQGGFKRWMPLHSGVLDLVSSVVGMGAEFWVTTTRPYLRLDSVDPDTREWLVRNGIHFDHLLYDEKKYRVLGQQVDRDRVVAIIEDLPEQYEEAFRVFGSHVALLVERQHNLAYREARKGTGLRSSSIRSLREGTLLVTDQIREWQRSHA